MTPERKAFWTATLSTFAVLWPFFDPSPAMADVYDTLLADLELGELERAVVSILKTTTSKDAPKPGEIREAVEGKLTWVDVWQRDLWGSLTLKNGARVSVGRKQVRVREGEEPPLLLSWGTVDDEHWGGVRPGKPEPLMLPRSLTDRIGNGPSQ